MQEHFSLWKSINRVNYINILKGKFYLIMLLKGDKALIKFIIYDHSNSQQIKIEENLFTDKGNLS